MITPEEIEARIAAAFGDSIQDDLYGIVVLNADGSNPAEDLPYTIPVQIDGQPETLYARYDPLADATAFANGSPVLLKYNADGELEARFDALRGREAYGGVIPTRNMLFFQHTHQSPTTGGKLAADQVFDSGAVQYEHGGLERDLSGFTDGVLYLHNNTSGAVALAPGAAGNVATSDGTVWTSAAPAGGSSPFTYAAPVIYPDNTTDVLTIGGTANVGKLGIIGTADQTQLYIIGHATQTTPLTNILNNSEQSLFKMGTAELVINDGTAAYNMLVKTGFVQSGGAFNVNAANGTFNAWFESAESSFSLFHEASTGRWGQATNAPTDWLHLRESTTAAAALRIPAGVAPTSPNDGARWHDSTRKAMMTKVAGNTGSDLQGLFVQTALTGSSNNTAAFSVFGTGVTSRTLAANFFTVGKGLEIEVWGIYQTDGARDIVWTLLAGSTTLASQSISGHTSGGAGARFWYGKFVIGCYTTGATGTVWAQGVIYLHDNTIIRMFNSSTVVLNTTASHALDLTWDYNTATASTNAYAGYVSIKELN